MSTSAPSPNRPLSTWALVSLILYAFVCLSIMLSLNPSNNFESPDAPTVVQYDNGTTEAVLQEGYLYSSFSAIPIVPDVGVVFDVGGPLKVLGHGSDLRVKPLGSNSVRVTFAEGAVPVQGQIYTVPVKRLADKVQLYLQVTPGTAGPAIVNIKSGITNKSYVFVLLALIPPGIVAFFISLVRNQEDETPPPVGAIPQS